DPGQPVKRMRLRHAEAEHAMFDGVRGNAAAVELFARRVSGKFQRMQIGESALPAREWRAPIGTVGNFSLVGHVRLSLRSTSAPLKQPVRAAPPCRSCRRSCAAKDPPDRFATAPCMAP